MSTGRHLWKLCIATLAAAWLSVLPGCGGGGGSGGGSDGPTLAGNFFPLAVGDRWVYTNDAGAQATVRATGTRVVDGQTGIVVQTEDPTEGLNEAVYIVTAAGVREVPTAQTDPLVAAVGAVELMRFPLVAGDSFVQIDRTVSTGEDFDGDGRIEQAQVRSEVTVIGLETATTPAGSFAGSAHLQTVLTARIRLTGQQQTVTLTMTMDDWYAPDLGPVRSVLTTTVDGIAETVTMGVSAFRVSARRSESVAPAVLAFTPSDGGTVGAAPRATVTFSEPMDSASVAAGLTLADAAGQPVAARVEWDGATAALVPTVGLAHGQRFGVRLAAGVEDLAGNPLGADLRWSFEVDLTGPVLLSSTPADGASDVALDAPVVLRFDEPIDPASIGPGVLLLSDGTDYLPYALTVDGATLTLTPNAALERARNHEVYVDGQLRDQAGNALGTGLRLRFRVDAGRFAAPVELMQTGTIGAVAVGDIDGDGRADAVFGTNFFGPQPFQLVLRRQQPDGSLGPAQALATRASYVCPPSSIAIGDLDGDGRNDLALGESGCGIEIFRQGVDGQLRAAEFIDSAQSATVRLADFNRDGRLDLAGTGFYGNALQVWLQASDGTMVAHASPAFEHASGSDMDVGDVNGDGRPDIVVTTGNYPDASIGIVLQQGDGSFGPVQTRTADPPAGMAGVAVGDVNGDGRADIVVAFGGNGGRVGVILQQAGGSLGPMTTQDSYDVPIQVEIADVNGDGRLDVVVGHSGWHAAGVYLQQPDSRLGNEVRYPAPYGSQSAQAMAIGDLNGDGRPDLLVAEGLLLQKSVGTFAQSVRHWPGVAR